MNDCSNCGTQFTHVAESVVVMQGAEVIAALCPECVSGVKKAKIVLTRQGDVFEYDQYAALEMVQKAFGKTA